VSAPGGRRLEDLRPCFQGVIPSVIATCSRSGEPNVTYLSQVHYLDERHVALSCQFFNKTRRNVEENPYASVVVYDPLTFDAWRLRLRLDHCETEGELFDSMAMRIEVIASHTGMSGVFRLISADVYEVLDFEPVADFLLPPDPVLDAQAPPTVAGPLTELRGLQAVSARIARARDLGELVEGALVTLDELLGFSHGILLRADEERRKLVVIGSRGYGAAGLGGELCIGEGLIGTVAERRRMLRVAGMGAELRYGRAIRGRVEERGESGQLGPEIPLPGLPDAQAQLGLPLLAGDRLVGVLAVESRDPLCFDDWDEAFLQIVANQIGLGIDRVSPPAAVDSPARTADDARPRRGFVFYPSDDCVFVDGEYLVRNVPGRILWKLLRQSQGARRTEFTNRELRLDPTLGLPAYKDNLESRLILLRGRLAERCPELRLVPVRRGRFALELDCEIELEER
jgi:adenylate cyclase